MYRLYNFHLHSPIIQPAEIKGDIFNYIIDEIYKEYIFAETYHQHNPNVADGLEALGKVLEAMASAGTPMVYTENHMILGEGNFVLTVSEGQFLGKHVAFYDLFRIDNCRIVEHWDTIEEIPLKDKWVNNNGKF